MSDAATSKSFQPVDPQRFRQAQYSTRVSIAVNLVLVLAQFSAGWIAHAQSLIADSLHTASDLLADFLVLAANRQGAHPADSDHPYGHARVETAASLILGALLVATGAGLLISAGSRLHLAEEMPPVQPLALWVAIATLAAKEGLFRYLLRVAERLRSPMLIANAWHARSDAASSLVVAVGIAGALAGYRFLDLLAAALVGFLIARMGWKFGYDALRELIDTGLAAEKVARIRATVLGTPGVIDCHELRTRRMAHQALVDAHVQVGARISVSEGHRIAEQARERVLAAHPEVLDVLVHVDAECDLAGDRGSASLPGRAELMRHLSRMLDGEVTEADRVLLHYLGDKVEAEVFLTGPCCDDAQRTRELEQRIARALPGDPYFRAITLNCRLAP